MFIAAIAKRAELERIEAGEEQLKAAVMLTEWLLEGTTMRKRSLS